METGRPLGLEAEKTQQAKRKILKEETEKKGRKQIYFSFSILLQSWKIPQKTFIFSLLPRGCRNIHI